ncbi:MAG: hypothetical protein IT374_25850 [Polyangiaceae bacterium]|nr:hypothetical protein [Polyangiaceae bacterium]
MNKTFASLLAATVLVGAITAGCKTVCKDNESGGTECVTETVTQYVGSTVEQSYAYTAGTPINIKVEGGNVRLGSTAAQSIVVKRGAPAGTVTVRFTPLNAETAENKDKAIRQMNENLSLGVNADASGVAISVTRTGTVSSALTARVDLFVPDDFAGALSAVSPSGDIYIENVQRGVTATTSGEVTVLFAGPVAASDSGLMKGNKVYVDFDQRSSLGLQVQSGDLQPIAYPNPLPATWVKSEASPSSMSFTANAGGSTPWQVQATFDVTIALH